MHRVFGTPGKQSCQRLAFVSFLPPMGAVCIEGDLESPGRDTALSRFPGCTSNALSDRFGTQPAHGANGDINVSHGYLKHFNIEISA